MAAPACHAAVIIQKGSLRRRRTRVGTALRPRATADTPAESARAGILRPRLRRQRRRSCARRPAPSHQRSPRRRSTPATVAPEKKADGTQLKDGVFYGWGTSRHGDIQASVEIKNGKIIGAYISQCRTQYSCSWVSALPGQVVQRQSAEVDYVSGATQSSNAFYYAVVEALKKARG